MKKLLVWLASAFVCTAQAVSIGPFATEGWVEEKIKEAESVTNGLASVSYVDDVADGIRADFPDVSGFATKDWVGQAITNAVDDLVIDWNSVTNKPHFINGTDVTNMLPSWVVVPIPPVTVEVDPAFTNWLATTNAVIGRVAATNEHYIYVGPDQFKIEDFSGGGIAIETDPVFTAWKGSNLYVRTVHTGNVIINGALIHGGADAGSVSNSHAEGSGTKTHAASSHAEGYNTRTASDALGAHAEGNESRAGGQYSHVDGYRAVSGSSTSGGGSVSGNHHYAWVWNGDTSIGQGWFFSKGPGTFNINPVGGAEGFWISGTNLATYLQNAGGGGGDVTKAYVDSHKWDWGTQVTNAPAFITAEVDPAFTNWLATSNAVYRDLDGRWVDSSNTNTAVDPACLLKYESGGSGMVQTLAGDMLFYPQNVAVFLNGDDNGYMLKNTYRDQTVDLTPVVKLTDTELGIFTEGEMAASMGFTVYDYYDNTRYTSREVIKGSDVKYHYTWPDKTGVIALTNDIPDISSFYQDRIKTQNGLNEAYVSSSGVYYKSPSGYSLPMTMTFDADVPVRVGDEMFPSNYTVVINPAVQSNRAPPVPDNIIGISADGKWVINLTSGNGYISYYDSLTAAQSYVFRVEGFKTENSFSVVLDPAIVVDPEPGATFVRTREFSSDKLSTEKYVNGLLADFARPSIDYPDTVLSLSWGSGAFETAYLPYYANPSDIPQASQGAITTNGNGSVNVSRLYSNSVSGNDNFVFGNNNSVFGDNVTVFGNGNMVTNSSGAAVLGQSAHTVKDSASSIVSGSGGIDLESSPNSIITGVGGTTAINSGSSFVLSGGGGSVNNSPNATFLAPIGTVVYDSQNIIIGGYHHNVVSNAPYSVVLGGTTVVTNQYVFMWNGGYGQYADHGPRTFNVNPADGTDGFYVGENSLTSLLALDAIAPVFLPENIYTNGDYVLKDRRLYECTNYTGAAGWRANDWQQTTVTGILGNLRRILDAINGEAL